ncbi:MAG: PQQ-binding-like beta-propeller repeat protein [Phenylobacterium sp.]|uniref:pyrroloquinoline quinone-dependent dehydrogenase n=1 Tax=Phenylobacterium sp. TaxID=1871053 RepID=UPI0025DBC081|nr:pyrroloquinoline quinone-dependent dehydrogenase [Phenylobacterium sp.]MBI1197596.1 PQQ-binding-like beta-propeller repeat protein [Phenylobacterium sp.]
MAGLARRILLGAAATLALAGGGGAQADEWGAYGRDPGGTRFSPLDQITPANVARLKPAWTFHTGDIADGSDGPRSGFETTPLMVDGRLYLTTPFSRVVALDPATGRRLWAFDPKIDRRLPYGDGLINRGVAAWTDPKGGRALCALSIFEATLDARLVALDGATGRPCPKFGTDGQVSLTDVKRYRPGYYHMTSPPVVVDDVVVVGSAIDDNGDAEMPDGVVRGFDARTGELLWSWEPIERPEGVAPEAWKTGAANAWTILSADPARHLVFVPTGSASPDYYGGLRPGDDRWSNSVVALDVRTGKLAWGFQLVHHDLWDYDTAAAPLATTLTLDGRETPVVIAGNKTGMVYALDPASGAPVLPIEERPVPPSDTPGETASPTQPFPVTLPGLAPQTFTPDQAFGLNDEDRRACAAALAELSGTSIFTPPSLTGALAVPGNVGGINWSGFAWDARRQRLIVSVSNLPVKVRLIPKEKFEGGDRGDLRAETTMQHGTPYAMSRQPLRGPVAGAPCVPPPWGELVALDLAKGEIAWRTPLGSLEDIAPGIGEVAKGSLALGGPIVTAGGLVFSGGTLDRRFRAFSAETGEELWNAELPASAHATPMTYEVGGRQYVVIAAGGSAKITEEVQSDALIAYALDPAAP